MSQPLGRLFEEYVEIVRRLRKECPWDREQTHESLRMHLLEEAYEVVDSIDKADWHHLAEELGDLLLHVSMHGVIAEEHNEYSIADVLERSVEKLIRRHPHVFGDAHVTSKEDVKKNWERSKKAEGRKSSTDGLPLALPALLRAYRLQDKVSKVGFDWSRPEDVWKKVEEETAELQDAVSAGVESQTEKEMGDLLFSIVNYARHIGVHPEEALRRSTETFEQRFRYVENRLDAEGLTPDKASLTRMDLLWEESKKSAPGPG